MNVYPAKPYADPALAPRSRESSTERSSSIGSSVVETRYADAVQPVTSACAARTAGSTVSPSPARRRAQAAAAGRAAS
ncbi:MAG: hypothetical protein IPN17_35025 [Deltaproteobacteria bacterium]|nr:hypothetical protein [Deltaproteobacteria bacterium]